MDYLKSNKFKRGLVVLEKHTLSFNFNYPSLKVCIDNNMDKPRMVLGNDLLEDGISINPNAIPSAQELHVWRKGMKKWQNCRMLLSNSP